MRRGEVRVTADVAVFKHHMTEMMAIVANEAIAPVVEGVAELPRSGNRFILLAHGVEAKIHAAEVYRLGVAFAYLDYLPTAQTIAQ